MGGEGGRQCYVWAGLGCVGKECICTSGAFVLPTQGGASVYMALVLSLYSMRIHVTMIRGSPLSVWQTGESPGRDGSVSPT